MLTGKSIAFIGAGNMGSALIRALVAKGVISGEQIVAADADPHRLAKLHQEQGIRIARTNCEAVTAAELVILAVKPQNVEEVLDEIAPMVDESRCVVSIVAGVTTRRIEGHLPGGGRVIRVMPNTPALVGEGIAAVCAGSRATPEDIASACAVFDAVGRTCVLPEALMDAVTGLSASGPAYVLLFIEALSDAGVLVGLPRDVSLTFSVQTVLGTARLAAEMIPRHAGHPAQLREMVTSPGGTTIAGLKKLEEGGLRAAVLNAVEAATARSRELGR